MRVETERRRAVDEPDPDAEREVDLARYGWAILSRWWLVLAAAAVGAVIGWLVSVGGGDVYQARATVYPGQPLTPSSNSQIQSLQTNPTTINQIVKSESVVRSVANQVEVSPDELRSGISTRGVTGAVARAGQAQLVEVSVRGPWRRQSAEAANLLSEIAVQRLSTYPDAKIEQLRARLAGIREQLTALDESIEGYRAVLEDQQALSTTDRLVVVGLLSNAQSQRGQLIAQESETSLSLSLAEDVERGRVITRATANKVAAQSSRSSIVVGAVIGLVVGILLALLWDPLRRRFGRRRPEQPSAQ
jgi:capsular polysaccharide biosynthesis protein